MRRTASLTPSTWHDVLIKLVALAVAANGLLILWTTLFNGVIDRDQFRGGGTNLNVHLIAALTLLYLSQLLWRRKRAAWAVTIPVYSFILGINFMQALAAFDRHRTSFVFIGRDVLFPLLVVIVLILCRNFYTVKSDIRNFAVSLRFVGIAMVVTFVYGVIGFTVLGQKDFHHHMSLWEAAHRTIDQFNITTNNNVTPHTRRARLFVDTLSTVSIAALAYSVISFFQPLKARYSDQSVARERMRGILEASPANSEDFFKLWPEDKMYVFDNYNAAGIAYRVEMGVGMSCGAPAGLKPALGRVINEFEDMCQTNDWLPAFIHVTDELENLYKKHGYSLQKLGEEAVIDVAHFEQTVRTNKYFRNISNRFAKQGFSLEMLQPPHSQALIARLQEVSDQWLTLPGRAERGFMMGYFHEDYLQMSSLIVARDAAGTIQGFINRIPSYDPDEANYDMLRHTPSSPSNVNDYILMGLLAELHQEGVKRFNLGLCPLAGLKDESTERGLIDNALHFIFANGDRFYSFSGLQRFKSKYEPIWVSRYVAYKGGLRGFTRTMNSLTRAMRVKL